jgi:hypothetical protein
MYQVVNANLEYISGRNNGYILTDNKEFGYVFSLEEAQQKLMFFNMYFKCTFLITEYKAVA